MSQRSDQVAEELRKIISAIMLDDLSHLSLGFITITRVALTDDLRYAKIYYSVLGPEEQRIDTEQILAENLTYIRRLAVQRINMRYAMEIRFISDRSLEYSQHIDEIIKKIKDKDQKPEEG